MRRATFELGLIPQIATCIPLGIRFFGCFWLNAFIHSRHLTPRIPFQNPIGKVNVFVFFRPKTIPADVSFEIKKSSCISGVIKNLEHVQLRLHLTFSRRGQIAVDITSPSKTKSRFVYARKFDIVSRRQHYTDFVTTSYHFWGEPSIGTWKISVINELPESPGSGKSRA